VIHGGCPPIGCLPLFSSYLTQDNYDGVLVVEGVDSLEKHEGSFYKVGGGLEWVFVKTGFFET
jgi:hypothetical protein